jgi:trehalose-6-phosphate synthase
VIVAGAYPISIEHRRFADAARDDAILRRARRVKERVGGRRILLGVDRLDYTKGIDVRLEAWRELLRAEEVRPDEHVLIQTAVPSRENVGAYRKLRRQVEVLVGEINGDHGTLGRPVVQYLHRSLPFEELVALYVAADVMVVTPLRDGMNLVAKEFVSSRVDEDGVLVLSEFTGAAHELKQALIVNPHDVEGLAATLRSALALPEKERKGRMRAMRTTVRQHDVHAWARGFLGDLQRTEEGVVELRSAPRPVEIARPPATVSTMPGRRRPGPRPGSRR